MIRNIETVCSGNHFRSKIAQAVFKRELKERSINGVDVISTGTNVDKIAQLKRVIGEERLRLLIPLVTPHLDSAVGYGIITEEEAEMFKLYQRTLIFPHLRLWYQGKEQKSEEIFCSFTIGRDREKIINRLLEKEMENANSRQDVVREMGLEEYFDYSEPKQTKIRKNAELILPISKDNFERINGIYRSVKNKPRIELLGEVEDLVFGIYRDMVGAAKEIERLSVEKVSDIYDNN